MPYTDLINLFFTILIFLFFVWGAFVSYNENERAAAFRMLFISFFAITPFVLPVVFHFNYWYEYSISLWSIGGIAFLFFFLPIHGKISIRNFPKNRFDERDTIFSRRRLKPNTKRYIEYYSDKPDQEISDTKLFFKNGLLQKGTKFYNAFHFAAAKASFTTVEQLENIITCKPSEEKIEVDPQKISAFIEEWSKKLGARDSGVTHLKDYHLYSFGGFNKHFGEPILNNHKYAIAFLAEMDKAMINPAPQGSAVMESAQQYLAPGTVAVQIASFIRNLGYEASAHIDGNYQVICPLVARDAGLGEIGRMGLLMTPKQGPRVRISVVTTDMPLVDNNSKYDYSINEFCSICKKCADVCPSGAISHDDKKEIDGIERWKINPEACYSVWGSFGTDCGRCMAVCPYSHPNNSFHNLVRFGIKHFPNFRPLALWMDNFFYDRKPKSKKMVDWMQI
ncbi:MAG: 4Fe-4S dicluster domain-containing protein [Melioribacteraceae bacterium]|jgi:reductive dehalogenase|nr:4Fe-4S dicluster domain-containing protein [Melioribacteraceae bacterium]